ncbi:MAG: DUF2818 family protein [Limnobacter sp.]|nr:DUF2818 family protein [Limnobacter sp.]
MVLGLLAVLCANGPFVSDRVLGMHWQPGAKRKGLEQGSQREFAKKPGGVRVLELLAGYALVLGVAVWLETVVGAVHPQAWQFYAVTACLYLVAGFPGFVYRFLWRGLV